MPLIAVSDASRVGLATRMTATVLKWHSPRRAAAPLCALAAAEAARQRSGRDSLLRDITRACACTWSFIRIARLIPLTVVIAISSDPAVEVVVELAVEVVVVAITSEPSRSAGIARRRNAASTKEVRKVTVSANNHILILALHIVKYSVILSNEINKYLDSIAARRAEAQVQHLPTHSPSMPSRMVEARFLSQPKHHSDYEVKRPISLAAPRAFENRVSFE